MVTAQYQAALHSYAEGRYEEATQQFSELLHEDPRNPKLHIWLGATFRKAGKMEYAKVQYQQVLTLTDDPDLLDLASTSLAQIQNKLFSGSPQDRLDNPQEDRVHADRPSIQRSPSYPKNHRADKAQEATYRALQLEVQNARKANGISEHSISESVTVDHFIETVVDSRNSTTGGGGISSRGANHPEITVSTSVQMNGNGKVPPPPVVLLQGRNTQEQPKYLELMQPNEQLNEQLSGGESVEIENVDDKFAASRPTASVLKDTIANIQDVPQNDQQAVSLPPVGSLGLSPRTIIRRSDGSAIALEDLMKFSSITQKITMWGALVATIPAIALGIAAYQVGDGLLLSKTKQLQRAEAIALANVAGNFLKQQTVDVEVLQKLLMTTDVGQTTPPKTSPTSPKPTTPPATANAKSPVSPANVKAPSPNQSSLVTQQRQTKQQLTNRLNLYAQAYPKYTSVALFSTNGELLAQSANSTTLQVISPDLLKKVNSADAKATSNPTSKVWLSNPVLGKDGVNLYMATPIKSTDSQKTNLLLQVEVPMQQLANELTKTTANSPNGFKNSDFYVVDSANKYVASSQPVTLGGDALTNFEMLSDWRVSWRTAPASELTGGARNGQILAYAPISNFQTDDSLSWDLITTVDQTKAIAGNQNLLLVIGIGIASTPLIVVAIGYALSRKLSSRLKHIRVALRDLREGKTDLSLGNLSTEGNDEISDISLSINKMSEQFQTMMQKQELEKQNLQLQITKLFRVLTKLAREDHQEVQDVDLSDEKILSLGKKVRAEIVQRHAEVENYRQQKEELQGKLMQMLKDVQALTDGDLTVATQSVDGSLANVAIFFDDVVRGLQNIIGQVKASATQVNFALEQNESAIGKLMGASQNQLDMVTQSLDTVQASQLSTSRVVEHSHQVSQSSQLVVEKIADGDRSIDAVLSKVGELKNTVATTAKRIKHLGMSSEKVVKAISTINEIAIKTNFLAINATLEASRTGDVSGGFVMVAEEVGELAARSVAASKEIESLLLNIQTETNAAMAAVESGSHQIAESNTLAIAAKDSLQQITQISQQIDGLMVVIAEATSSQVQTSEGVANLMNDIAHMAKRTISSSSEAALLIKETKEYSTELQQSLTHFKTR